MRKAGQEMIRKDVESFLEPSGTGKLTERGMKLNGSITTRDYMTIEVHPTSSLKASEVPKKTRKRLQ